MHLHADVDGSTFISTTAWRLFVSVFYIRTSQSPSGHTNAMAESFFGALKNECVSRVTYLTRVAARQDITRYIEFWYNCKRLHSTVGYRPPREVHAEYEKLRIVA
ncbi:integrase core domain-containing protein [Streptomyces mirabilis]|uniref:integrase core domain-containing protein n=1 Tax=Streptomyces mirabilis TaxID=68239 RepID=UPI003D9F0C92